MILKRNTGRKDLDRNSAKVARFFFNRPQNINAELADLFDPNYLRLIIFSITPGYWYDLYFCFIFLKSLILHTIL